MKIALVHDDIIQWGGAERLLATMHEIWPEAPIYTSIFDPPDICRKQFLSSQIITSWMQHLPFKRRLTRQYFLLYPLAFEDFDFTEYDVVLSSSARFAHGVITKPQTLHIAYINSPPRMFWEPRDYFEDEGPIFRAFLAPFLNYLRLWDKVSSTRPDFIIANARTSQQRIKKYYRRDAEIIYPFVDIERFKDKEGKRWVGDENYFLIVSRLVRWKRIDIAIEACTNLKVPLKIIGSGPDYQNLKKLSGPAVEFLGSLTDGEVVGYYKHCKAFVFPQEEDFGITPLEAMAAGKPVIAYEAGGALETIIEGQVGEFFYPQTGEALSRVIKNFIPRRYDKGVCQKQALRFSKERFKRELKSFVKRKFSEYEPKRK